MSEATETLLVATDELLAARIDWIEARQRRMVRDSHANRIAEEAAWIDVEVALDLWCEERGNCE